MSGSSRGYSRLIAAVALLSPLVVASLLWTGLSGSWNPASGLGQVYLPVPCATTTPPPAGRPPVENDRVCIAVPSAAPDPTETPDPASAEVAGDGETEASTPTPTGSATASAAARNDWEAFGGGWSAAVASWLGPLVAPSTGVLVVVVALLLAARLFVYLPMNPWGRVGRRRSALLLAAGATAIVVGAVAFVLLVGSLGDDGARAPRVLREGLDPVPAVRLALIPLLVALWGSLALSRVAASRLRVGVNVGPGTAAADPGTPPEPSAAGEETGGGPAGLQTALPTGTEEDRAESGEAAGSTASAARNEVALRFADAVRSLCKEDATSIELPAPGDGVETLVRHAIADIPVTSTTVSATASIRGKVLGALKTVVLWFLGQTPWVVTLTVVGEDIDHLTVRRNGRVIVHERIDASLLPRAAGEDTSRDRTLLAAATLVILLARAHPGFGALAGASDPLALALHSVATTDHRHDLRSAAKLLQVAHQRDPGNLSVVVALQRARFRTTEIPARMTLYGDWLWEFDTRHRWGPRASGRTIVDLRCRVLATYLALCRNGVDSPERYRSALRRLHGLVFLRGSVTALVRRRPSAALREAVRAELAVCAAVTLADREGTWMRDRRRPCRLVIAEGTELVLAPRSTFREPSGRSISVSSVVRATTVGEVVGLVPRGAWVPRLSVPAGTQLRLQDESVLTVDDEGTALVTGVPVSTVLVVCSASATCTAPTVVRPVGRWRAIVAWSAGKRWVDAVAGTRWRDRWFARASASPDPHLAYSVACMLTRGGHVGEDAVELFRVACEVPALRSWLRRDPELAIPSGRRSSGVSSPGWENVAALTRSYGWDWRSDPVIDEFCRRVGLPEDLEPWDPSLLDDEPAATAVGTAEVAAAATQEASAVAPPQGEAAGPGSPVQPSAAEAASRRRRADLVRLIDAADQRPGPLDTQSEEPTEQDRALRRRLIAILLEAGIASREAIVPRRLRELRADVGRAVDPAATPGGAAESEPTDLAMTWLQGLAAE